MKHSADHGSIRYVSTGDEEEPESEEDEDVEEEEDDEGAEGEEAGANGVKGKLTLNYFERITTW